MFIILKKILWSITTILLFSSSIYFLIKLRFTNFNINKIIKNIKFKKSSNIISTLFLSIGGRIGVGSIVGVSLMIKVGGPGTCFWLLIFSSITSIISFVEVIMSSKYKIRIKNSFYGGPSYYIKYGLNKKILGIIYSLILLFCYIFGFIGIQANTIATCTRYYFDIPKLVIAITLICILFFIIIGGSKRIMNFSKIIVPIMLLIYIFSSLYIIYLNRSNLLNTFYIIFKSAFSLKPFFSSFIPMIIISASRSIFASESGIGTGAVSSSASNDQDVIKQGYIQLLGVYLSIFICLLTSLVILISNIDINNSLIINSIFHNFFGVIGDIIYLVSIILFSFSTILTGYYYCESSIVFIYHKSNKLLKLIKILTLISLYIGIMIKEELIWQITDIFISILALINIYGIFLLRKVFFEQIYYDK